MGCSTSFTKIAPEPPENYERLGFAHGKATGSLGILGTAYYFIPMGLNSRIDKAYDRALESVPGATSLINVTYQESWYWWLIGTARTVSISGDAIREVTQ
jgi:hypothetical protein